MNNTTILVGLIIVLVAVGGFVFLDSDEGVSIENMDAEVLDGSMQRVVISQNGYNYADIQAEADKPIAISLDSSVKGCLRAVVFVINGERYSKFLVTPEDILILPALEEGTYDFSCTMGMGFGKLRVE